MVERFFLAQVFLLLLSLGYVSQDWRIFPALILYAIWELTTLAYYGDSHYFTKQSIVPRTDVFEPISTSIFLRITFSTLLLIVLLHPYVHTFYLKWRQSLSSKMNNQLESE